MQVSVLRGLNIHFSYGVVSEDVDEGGILQFCAPLEKAVLMIKDNYSFHRLVNECLDGGVWCVDRVS